MARSRSDPFKTPSPAYNYEPVIEAMAACREQVLKLSRECGNRTPLQSEATAVLADLEGLAKLLPVEDAVERVSPALGLPATR